MAKRKDLQNEIKMLQRRIRLHQEGYDVEYDVEEEEEFAAPTLRVNSIVGLGACLVGGFLFAYIKGFKFIIKKLISFDLVYILSDIASKRIIDGHRKRLH